MLVTFIIELTLNYDFFGQIKFLQIQFDLEVEFEYN